MTIGYVDRAGWNARPPRSVTPAPWSWRTGFVTHYSFGDKTQTVRSIQDWHMDGRGWSDIGYNWLVDYRGTIYIGRGWDAVGAHVLNHNTENIGACFIGFDADVTDAAKRALRALYDEAVRLKGEPLLKLCHLDLASTSCPGGNLAAWVHSGMEVPEGMLTQEQRDQILANLGRVTQALYEGTDQVTGLTVSAGAPDHFTLAVPVDLSVDELSTAILNGLDYDRLATAIAARMTQRPLSISLSGSMTGTGTPQGG